MEVNFAPELESSLIDLAEKSGCEPGELVEGVMAGYVAEMVNTRTKLDSRYDDLASGKVKPIDGEEFFKSLLQKAKELSTRTPK